MTNFKLIRLLFVITITAVLAGGLAAQSVNTPPTLLTLNLERVLDAKTILTTLTPNIPPAILAGVVAGALEVRESASLNPANQVLTVNAFTAQTGAPIPTPTANITSIFSTATMNVDKVYSALTPRPSVMLAG